LVCAAVCAGVWHLQHGEVQPFIADISLPTNDATSSPRC
jgi:hypothetical protein